ncbi:MAG: DMT family transporter [Burkholderiales bacterium]|nr:DMT family transporter [Burkholderiales bacterium]
MRFENFSAYAALASAMMIVGAYVGFSKVLVAVFPVFLLAWLRFGIAAVAMATWVKRAPDEPKLDARTRRLIFLESFLGNFLFSICMLYGMRQASAISAGVVMACIPAAVALLSRVFLNERLSPRTLAAIAFAVLGVGLLALSRNDASADDSSLFGTALLIGAVLCEASYVVIGKRLTGQVSPKRISALINLWGLALVTPLGVWAALSFDFPSVTLPIWGGLALYALAASMWTVWLWMTGLKKIPAAKAGIFTVFLPITSALVGVLFLGEQFTHTHLAAFACALAGVVLATWPVRERPAL